MTAWILRTFGCISCVMIVRIHFLWLLPLAACTLPGAAADSVSSLRFSPSAFDSFRTNTEIRYTLKSPSAISIDIVHRDSMGQLLSVNTLAENINETRGSHAHTWLGDTRSGFFAPSGLYIGVLRIGDQRYETVVRVFHF